MATLNPWRFALTHSGRGGQIVCSSEHGEVSLPIELVEGDAFAVHLRGARLHMPGKRARALRANERDDLASQLRGWLEAAGKSRWSLE